MRALLTAAAIALASSPALSQDGPVTIVMNLELSEGSTIRGALTEIRPILEHIRAQPGLLSETLLMGSVAVSQDYVHVMQWEDLAAWEALYEDDEFLALLSRMNPGFEPAIAEIYAAVPPAAQP